MSKGSGRRPQQADEQQVADNWAAIFGRKEPAQPDKERVTPERAAHSHASGPTPDIQDG